MVKDNNNALSAKQLKITQTGSGIGREYSQRLTLKGLGLGRMHRSRILLDNSSTRGMIFKVQHLVKVEAVE